MTTFTGVDAESFKRATLEWGGHRYSLINADIDVRFPRRDTGQLGFDGYVTSVEPIDEPDDMIEIPIENIPVAQIQRLIEQDRMVFDRILEEDSFEQTMPIIVFLESVLGQCSDPDETDHDS